MFRSEINYVRLDDMVGQNRVYHKALTTMEDSVQKIWMQMEGNSGKVKENLDETLNGINKILEDPFCVLENIAQGVTDTCEREGIAYCGGYGIGIYAGAKGIAEGAKSLKGVGKGVGESVIYGTDDIANYEFNMIENPGPLADIEGRPAGNFYGGRYNVETLTEDRIYYRGGNSEKAIGQWFTKEPPESVAKVRIDTAVKPQWLDPVTGEMTGESVVDTVYAIKIPKGTNVYTGPVGSQGGVYCGGYDVMQSFIEEPWKLDYKVISSSPMN